MNYIWNLLSPPASPTRQQATQQAEPGLDPGDQLLTTLVQDGQVYMVDQVDTTDQNYVEFNNGEKRYFDHIWGCKVSTAGDLYFYLAWAEIVENIDLSLSDIPIHARRLYHNDNTTAWTERFEKWSNEIRDQLPFDTLLFWDDMKSIFTVHAGLELWLESRGLSVLKPVFEEHGCISIDMLPHLDKKTLLQWGVSLFHTRLIMKDIQTIGNNQ